MTPPQPLNRAGYQQVNPDSAVAGVRDWWNSNHEPYMAEHGEFLGSRDFCWCPEGLRESTARLLGDVAGKDIVEIGAGAAQCSRWLLDQGARVVATDIAENMLTGLSADGPHPTCLAADAQQLPFAPDSFDIAFSAYGAIPFLPGLDRVYQEVARILKPGGSWVFSITHPIRWAFPDDPGPRGLEVTRSYFDTRPYVEHDESGRVTYAEYHHTLADHLNALSGAGFLIKQTLEPRWPADMEHTWDGWSPLRGEKIPGTVIFVTQHLGTVG